MKGFIVCGVLLSSLLSLSACADQTPSEAAAVRVMSGSEPPQPLSAQDIQAAQSPAGAGKTRAEVYQELVNSEKSGEWETLNSTLYAH